MRFRQRRAALWGVDGWFRLQLRATGVPWVRGCSVNYQPYFWNDALGIVVTSGDGPWDAELLARTGVMVLRVQACDDVNAARLLGAIAVAEPWMDRQRQLGIPVVTWPDLQQREGRGQGWQKGNHQRKDTVS